MLCTSLEKCSERMRHAGNMTIKRFINTKTKACILNSAICEELNKFQYKSLWDFLKKFKNVCFLTYFLNKTVLLRDRKRRTARAPPPPTSKSFQNVCPIFCPKFCPFFLSIFCWGGTPGPPSLGVPPGGTPPVGGVPQGGAPPVGGYPQGAPPQLGGTPGGTPQLGCTPGGAPPVGGYPRGTPQLGGTPGGAPPPVGGTPGAPPMLGGVPPGVTPQLGGIPGGNPPVGGYPRGRPPCEQTNWKQYLPVILRMRAVKIKEFWDPSTYYQENRTLKCPRVSTDHLTNYLLLGTQKLIVHITVFPYSLKYKNSHRRPHIV